MSKKESNRRKRHRESVREYRQRPGVKEREKQYMRYAYRQRPKVKARAEESQKEYQREHVAIPTLVQINSYYYKPLEELVNTLKDRFGRPVFRSRSQAADQAVKEFLQRHGKWRSKRGLRTGKI
jgi:metal-responsive CopG/Arc/MetJ family transcriptional regulator